MVGRYPGCEGVDDGGVTSEGVLRACDNRAERNLAEHLERIMPELPSGTITFLVTDIEGSTALRKQARASIVPPPIPKNPDS